MENEMMKLNPLTANALLLRLVSLGGSESFGCFKGQMLTVVYLKMSLVEDVASQETWRRQRRRKGQAECSEPRQHLGSGEAI